MVEIALILLWSCLFVSNLATGDNVLGSALLPTATFGGSEIDSTRIFTDANNNTYVIVNTKSGTFLYKNDNLLNIKPYGDIWNGFSKDNHFHLYLWKNGTMCIYKFTKDSDMIPVTNIGIEGFLPERFRADSIISVVSAPDKDNLYYLVASSWILPANPVEVLFDFTSGGHGVYFWKPYLIDAQDGKLGKSKMLQYGGKRDESFYIKQVTQRGDLVHFLGLRQQEKRAWGKQKENFTPVILHHATYDLKKKKVIQTNPIYTDTPRGEEEKGILYRYDYGAFSIDALGDDIFVVFSWTKLSHRMNQIGEKYVESNIFYWDCFQSKVSKAEKIVDGFHPVVKADSLGNIHLLYVDDKANLMHKKKRGDVWQKENVLVESVATKPWARNIAATFDKDNNLHVVYPSDGSLVHSVIKAN